MKTSRQVPTSNVRLLNIDSQMYSGDISLSFYRAHAVLGMRIQTGRVTCKYTHKTVSRPIDGHPTRGA